MSSTEGTLRFIALMLLLTLPGLAVYLNRSRPGHGTDRGKREPSAGNTAAESRAISADASQANQQASEK
jgi:hypothetical protein